MAFLWIMAVGLIGLILMAIPGLQRHGHAGVPQLGGSHPIVPHAGGGVLRAGGHIAPGHTAAPHAGAAAHTGAQPATNGATAPDTGFQISRLIPAPRAIFSVMTLFGAIGYGLSSLTGMLPAILLAGALALAIERYAVGKLWNYLFQFQGKPTTPIEALLLCEAKALTPFRNGRGLVALEHDGRVVQFSARLHEPHIAMPVQVGDTLVVEEIDASTQRVVVSIK